MSYIADLYLLLISQIFSLPYFFDLYIWLISDTYIWHLYLTYIAAALPLAAFLVFSDSKLTTATVPCSATCCSFALIPANRGAYDTLLTLSFPLIIVVTIFTINGINGSHTSVQTTLNVVCAFAICLEITSISLPAGEINWTNFENHGIRKMNTILPLILKILCAIAVRFAFLNPCHPLFKKSSLCNAQELFFYIDLYLFVLSASITDWICFIRAS